MTTRLSTPKRFVVFSLIFALVGIFIVINLPLFALGPVQTIPVVRIGKVFGYANTAATPTPCWDCGINVSNPTLTIAPVGASPLTVGGTDLGAVTFYNNNLWFLLGDTNDEQEPNNDYIGSFLLFNTTDLVLSDGISIQGNTSQYHDFPGSGTAYYSMVNNPGDDYLLGDPLPSSMFTVEWNGQTHLFAHYMAPKEVEGNDHQIYRSNIAKYDPIDRVFKPYKRHQYGDLSKKLYEWRGGWRSFGFNTSWVDYDAGYLYVLGSPSGRYGGIQLARIKLEDFMDPTDNTYFDYLTNVQGNPPIATWSTNVNPFIRANGTYDTEGIQSDGTFPVLVNWTSGANTIRSAFWLIHPKMGLSSFRTETNAQYDQQDGECPPDTNENKFVETNSYCQLDLDGVISKSLLTIGEYSVVYNSYWHQFMILTGRVSSNSEGGGVWFYTSPSITGPWAHETKLLSNELRQGQTWQYYAPFTTEKLFVYENSNTVSMYFVASTFGPYGVYLYKASLPFCPTSITGDPCYLGTNAIRNNGGDRYQITNGGFYSFDTVTFNPDSTNGRLLTAIDRYNAGPCAYAPSGRLCEFETRTFSQHGSEKWERITAYGRYFKFDVLSNYAPDPLNGRLLTEIPRYSSWPCANAQQFGQTCRFDTLAFSTVGGGNLEIVTAYGRYYEFDANNYYQPTLNNDQLLTSIYRYINGPGPCSYALGQTCKFDSHTYFQQPNGPLWEIITAYGRCFMFNANNGYQPHSNNNSSLTSLDSCHP